jgi:hypothetical protein
MFVGRVMFLSFMRIRLGMTGSSVFCLRSREDFLDTNPPSEINALSATATKNLPFCRRFAGGFENQRLRSEWQACNLVRTAYKLPTSFNCCSALSLANP